MRIRLSSPRVFFKIRNSPPLSGQEVGVQVAEFRFSEDVVYTRFPRLDKETRHSSSTFRIHLRERCRTRIHYTGEENSPLVSSLRPPRRRIIANAYTAGRTTPRFLSFQSDSGAFVSSDAGHEKYLFSTRSRRVRVYLRAYD